MKILVFGGTGFLGKNLIEWLLAAGHEVGVYVRPKSMDNDFLHLHAKVIKLHVGEFQTENHFETLVSGYDAIYHLLSSTIPSIVNPLQDIETTIKPSLRLMEACVVNKVQRLIFFSSGGTVYGIPKRTPLEEDDEGQPLSAYGIQKQAIERYLRFYQYTFGLPVTILRISNPYGRYQRPFSKQGLIANILGNYLSGSPIEIWGDGKIVRDYIYVDDVMAAALKILKYEGKEVIFNIGSGVGTSVNDIIAAVETVLVDTLQVKRYQGRKVDVPINVLSIDRAKSELHWCPKVDLFNGLGKMLSLWNKEGKNFAGK